MYGVNGSQSSLASTLFQLPYGLNWLLLAGLGTSSSVSPIRSPVWLLSTQHLTNKRIAGVLTVCCLGTVSKESSCCSGKKGSCTGQWCLQNEWAQLRKGIRAGSSDLCSTHLARLHGGVGGWGAASPEIPSVFSHICLHLFHGVCHTLHTHSWIALIPTYLFSSPLLNCKLPRVGVLLL